MAQPLPSEVAHEVYDVLAGKCGATEGNSPFSPREHFVATMVSDDPPEEFRFCGDLGFGGKFRNRLPGEGLKVDCYPEDRNSERDRMVEEANAALAEIAARLARPSATP